MEEIVIVEPSFFNKFSCIGSACPDHCCKGWDIDLDEKTVDRYMQSESIEIRNIASDNIILTRESADNWGKVILNKEGNCTFLDNDRLCKIHKSLGEESLSTTCAIYPRLYASHKYEIRSNLTLSCPEAAKQLLLTPGAMQYTEKRKPSPQALNAPDIEQGHRLLNLMCTNIMSSCGIDLDAGFYSLILLLITHQDADDNYDNLLGCYDEIQTAMQDGNIRKMMEELEPDYKLQSLLLHRLNAYLSTKHGGRGWATLESYYVNLNSLIQSHDNAAPFIPVIQLQKIWYEKALPWFNNHSDLIINYIQYRMYEDFFPLKNGRLPFDNLFFLISEWSLLKWMTSAAIEADKDFSEQDFINIIYSYHSVTRHDKYAEDAFLAEIDKMSLKNKTSLAYLLK